MKFFLTGGSRGLGAEVTRWLASRGHEVAFTWRTGEAEAREFEEEARNQPEAGRCFSFPLDVGDPDQVDRTVSLALEALGGLDAVVNNAGVNRPGIAAWLSNRDWEETLATNLSGAFFVARAVLMEFMATGRGRLIHIGSVVAGGMKGEIAYAASKSGLEGLSATLAKEYGSYGITSNVLRVGLAGVGLSRTTAEDSVRAFWDDFCPAGRPATAEDVAAAVEFLASDAAGFINGAVLPLSGGLDWVP